MRTIPTNCKHCYDTNSVQLTWGGDESRWHGRCSTCGTEYSGLKEPRISGVDAIRAEVKSVPTTKGKS